VLLDTRRCAYPNGPTGLAAFEDAVDVAASVVLAFAGRRFPVRLVTTSGLSMHTRRCRSGAGRLLDAIADVVLDDDEVTPASDGDAAASHRGHRVEAGGAVRRGTAVRRGRMARGGRLVGGRVAFSGVAGLGVLATLPRGGVGTLTLVTGRVEVG